MHYVLCCVIARKSAISFRKIKVLSFMPVVMCALLVSSQTAQAPALRWSFCIRFVVKIIIRVGMGIFMTAIRIKKKYNQILNKRPHLTFTVHCLLCDCLLAAFSNLEVLCFIQQWNTKKHSTEWQRHMNCAFFSTLHAKK